MTPFIDPLRDPRDRPATLRRDAEVHRLARQARTRSPRRRTGLFGATPGNDAA